MQLRDIVAIYDGAQAKFYCRLLIAEIRGQYDYAERRGGFPLDQMAFVCAYLENAELAIAGDFGISADGIADAAPSDSDHADDCASLDCTYDPRPCNCGADDTATPVQGAATPVQGAACYHSRPLA